VCSRKSVCSGGTHRFFALYEIGFFSIVLTIILFLAIRVYAGAQVMLRTCTDMAGMLLTASAKNRRRIMNNCHTGSVSVLIATGYRELPKINYLVEN